MPYSKISDAHLKKLDDVPLTLDQINEIAKMADAIGGDKGWPIAISNFKKSHKIVGNHWESNSENDKEFSSTYVEKQSNGKYKIVAISTAAVRDKEDETFTTEAIDYDARISEETGEYPEFRVFHSKDLGIGKVTKMSRVGIFAVDEGESYDDPFSLEVCEKMLTNNDDGRWRVSRGFKVIEASGICKKCGENLLLKEIHLQIGHRCPVCKSVSMGSKGSLKSMRFLKARTFDITITDTPAVPWTGVTAVPVDKSQMEDLMATKKELRKRLLDAGMDESIVDARLDKISDEKLKEFDTIPDAILLKEFDAKENSDSDDNTFYLDEAVLGEFTKIVKKELTDLMNNLEVEVNDNEEVEKEDNIMTVIKELVDKVSNLEEVVQSLMRSDEDKMKELIEGTPRKGLMVLRNKACKRSSNDVEDYDDEDEDGEEEDRNLPTRSMRHRKEFGQYADPVLIMDSEGNRVKSMTEFIHGENK